MGPATRQWRVAGRLGSSRGGNLKRKEISGAQAIMVNALA